MDIHTDYKIQAPKNETQQGLTLVELIVFIAIFSIGILGLFSIIHFSILHSASPALMKQQLAIAEALLAEIEHKEKIEQSSFIPCTQTLVKSAVIDQTKNETKPHHPPQIKCKPSSINLMPGYTAKVDIHPAGTSIGLIDTAAFRITVTVSAQGQADLVLTAYRLRYEPNQSTSSLL